MDGNGVRAESTSPSAAYAKPLPEITPASRPFWDAAREHRLLIQRSTKTGEHLFYPRSLSPIAVDDSLEWVAVSGQGTVYTYTVARRPTAPPWAEDGPYIIAIVELDEGPRMMTNIIGCDPDTVAIGMRVRAVFDDVTPEVTLVKFAPA